MTSGRILTHAIADALAAGAWTPTTMRARVRHVVGPGAPWTAGLVALARKVHPEAPPRRSDLVALVDAYAPLQRALADPLRRPRLRAWLVPHSVMRAPPAWSESIPRLDDAHAVASWLGASDAQLARWSERLGSEYRPAHRAHRNYEYTWIAKPSGGARLLEAPRPRLRTLQRTVLRDLLDRVPPHGAAHGFCAGRSAITHASAHVGRALVLRVDLCDFFASIPRRRIHALFATLGYPDGVAATLAALCTHRTPPDVIASAPAPVNTDQVSTHNALRQRLREHHLPQGAPTSPALANLCAYRLDRRLDALARRAGATYTRYADDLTFSGDATFARRVSAFYRLVCGVVAEEGFRVNGRKTRRMRRGERQWVTGLVVNERLNVPRDAFERLEATLCNCARHGPASQNRAGHPAFRAHLEGRIAWIASVHPTRGAKLRAWFARIDWGR